MKKKPYSATRERIKHKQAERRRKRNLKITRIFFAMFLCTVVMVGVGWASVKLYEWGSATLETYMEIYFSKNDIYKSDLIEQNKNEKNTEPDSNQNNKIPESKNNMNNNEEEKNIKIQKDINIKKKRKIKKS